LLGDCLVQRDKTMHCSDKTCSNALAANTQSHSLTIQTASKWRTIRWRRRDASIGSRCSVTCLGREDGDGSWLQRKRRRRWRRLQRMQPTDTDQAPAQWSSPMQHVQRQWHQAAASAASAAASPAAEAFVQYMTVRISIRKEIANIAPTNVYRDDRVFIMTRATRTTYTERSRHRRQPHGDCTTRRQTGTSFCSGSKHYRHLRISLTSSRDEY